MLDIFYLMSFVWLNWFTYRSYRIYVLSSPILIIPSKGEQRQSFRRFAKALKHLFCPWIVDSMDKMKASQPEIWSSWSFAATTCCSETTPKYCHNVTEPVATSGSKVYRYAWMAVTGIHCKAILHWTAFHYLSAGLLVLVYMEVLGGAACSGL